MLKIYTIKQSLIFFTLLLLTTSLSAQPLPPSPTSPILGGVGILVLLGVLFGIRKYNRSKKK
ncbi:MAG: hypothetical protein U9R42_13770 [Bacteroidota bacterium]|nr:hypothetical protein [Bacteroidota bacterium]